MHALTPLSPGSTGDQVSDLHEALLALGFGGNLSPAERDPRTYGDTTAAAVAVFQRQNGLLGAGVVVGTVDPATARALDVALVRAGVLQEVTGELRTADGRPAGDVVVLVTDADQGPGAPLGTGSAQDDGSYDVFYDPRQVRDGRPPKDVVDLVVEVQSRDGVALVRSDPKRRPDATERVDLVVPEQDDRPGGSGGLVVRGNVRDPGGRPVAGIEVTAWDRDLGDRRDLLGRATTRSDGGFWIGYQPAAFTEGDVPRGGRTRADIVFDVRRGDQAVDVAVYPVEGGTRTTLPLTDDAVRLGIEARDDEQVELVLSAWLSPEGTEFDRLLAALQPLLGDRSPASLDEATFRDVSFAARETGQDRTRLGLLVAAHQQSASVFDSGVPAELLYGLARCDQRLTDLARLTLADDEHLRAGVAQAVAEAVITAPTDQVLADSVARIRARGPEQVRLGTPAAPAYGPVLDAAGLSTAQQDTLLAAAAGRQDDAPALWSALRADPAFATPGALDRAQFTLQLDDLTGRHLPLVAALQADRGVTSARALLDLGVDDLTELVRRVGVPDGADPVEGDGDPVDADQDRAATYAAALLSQAHLAFPTASVTRSLDQLDAGALGGPEAKAALATTLAVATSSDRREQGSAFDIRTSRVADYLAEHGDTVLADVPVADRPLVRPALERVQRLFRVSTGPAALGWLLAGPHHSAFDIARVPQTTFVAGVRDAAGVAAGLGETEARLMHSRSLTTASAMLATYVTIADARFGVSPAAIGGDRVVEGHAVDDAVATYLPSWSALFDEASWCDCPECRSVLSPAAYLVDLLAFLDATAPDAAGDSPLDVLLRRRPDLAQLPLTCENTNVTLPYVDLVLEVLESLVLSGDPATIPAYDTEDATSAELVATPQHTGWAAYLSAANPAAPTPPVRPDTAAYPPSLPYDAALAAVRGYAEHLGVPWRDVLETLAGPALPRPDARIAERLGLTPTGYALISGQTVEGGPADAAGLDERFGWTVTGHPELAAGSTGWGAWALAHALAAGGAAVVPATAPATQVADAAVVAAVGAVQTAAGLPVAATVDESTWAAVLAGTPAAPWLLTQVTTLLDRAEIGYDDLQALLRMRFVNPGQASFDILQALRLPTADLLAFQAAGLTGASPALEAALTARGVSLADFTAWAADHLLGPAWDVLRRSVLLDVPADGSGGLAAVTLRHWDDADPWLGEAEWLGLDRLLRLWRTLGWTLDQLDVVLVGLGARELTPAVLASVGQVADLAAGLGLPVEQVTALWTDLDPTRPGSVYQQLFRGRTARRVDPVFEPDWRGGVLAGATLEAHGPAVQAALRVSAADLALLVDAVGLDPTAALDLAGLSALHRRVRLARGLGHPVKDLVAVQQVTGIDPFTAPGPGWTAAALVTAVRRLDQAGLDPGRLTRITADVSSPTPPDETAAARVLGELRTGLRAVTAAADPALEHDGSQTRAALDTLGVPAALTDAVVQLLTGRFTTTQALAAAPVPAPAVDPAWSARARYSAIDRTVTVGEALTEAERVTLSGWSADPGWVAAVQAAFDAPRTVWAALSAALASAGVAPVPSVTLLDTALPSDPVARESAVVTRLQTLLAGLEPTLTDRRGRLLVAQTLAALPMDPALVAAVLDGTLDDGTPVLPAADPTRPVVVDLLAVAGGTDGDPLPAAAVAAYALLDRLRLLAEALGLAGDDAVALVRHVVALRATPDVLLAWPQVERALAYDRVRDRSAEPAAVAALAETTDPAALPALVGRVAGAGLDLVGALVAPTGWDLASDDLRDPVHLDQLLDALATVTALGVDPDVLLGWSRSPVGAETADGMRRAVAARYDDTTWLDVARSLNDPLREKRRAALVAHLAPRLGAGDADGLYQQLLIDVEMTPAVLTSRIKQAISTVQLFVQRALLDLEAEVAPTVIDRDHWGWMQSYRVWEANRLVLLFPWHWTLPELRDDKTPAFRELESALLGDELTPANTERALRGYLDALDEVANLEVVAVHVQRDFEATEKLESVVHIVGRTANLPRRTHYRRCTTTTTGVTTWTPWEVVPLDVVGDLVTAVTFQRRLYLFWASSTTKTKPAATSSTKAQDPTYLQELSLSWAEHRHGEWGPKHMTDAGTVLVSDLDPASPDPVVERLETRVEGGTLRVLGIASRSIIWTDEDKNISYEPVVVLDGSGTLPAGKDGNQGYTFSFGSFVLDGCHGKLVVSTERDQTWLEQGLVLRTTAGLEAKPLARTPVPAVGLLGRAPGARITEGAWIHPDGDAAVLADGHRTFLLTLHQVLRPGWETLATPERTYPQVGSALTTTTVDRSHAALLATTRLAGVLQNQQVAESQSHSWAAAGAALATVALRVPAGPGLDRLVAVDPAVPASRLDPGVRVSAVASNLGRWFARPQTTVSATFEPLFHPFVCTYLERLEQSGVPGLMTLANQRLLLLPNFATTYAPQPAVTKPYPTGTVDFGATATTGVYRSSAYSTYNWELFLHIPTLVATRLMQDQRFADALTWIHYVFDPTDTTRTYWRSLPLQTVPKESMQAWLQRLDSCDPELARLVAEWKDHPFQPHLIARMRLVTYQKYVVKLYLDIVLAWADNLYDRDTLESVNQATQLYVLAAELLGPRPRRLPPPGVPEPRTFAQLRDRLDALSNAAVEFENTFPTVSTATVSSTAEAVGVLGMGRTLYFCLPPDDRMLAYWDTVERRLFTIRHSMNRAGVLRQLPLFEPPIDPGLLVRAAAQGLSLDSVLAELDAPRPQHRFEHVLRRANDACADLKALGAQLLAALERRDSEQLTQLRAAHETAGLEAVLAERLVAERDAQAQVDAVAASREVPVERLRYLQLVTGAEEHVPQPGELLPAMSYAPKPQTEAGVALIPEESQELAALHSARDWQVRATMMEVMASLAHYIPSFAVHVEPFGVGAEIAFGGEHVGPALAAIGKYLGGLSAEDTYDATHASRMAVLRRRGQDFAYQANVAARELVAIDKQATVAAIGQELAVLQREHAEQAIERSRQVEQVLGSHYTDDELYGWMIGKLAGTYFGAYQLAYGLAKQAERCYRFERGISDSAIITFGAWDNLRKGLLAGEQLQLQLRQLERTHAEQHVRDLELTRHVSVLQHAPMALIALRETGTCEVDLPEWLFDLDHPGHYLRRLVTVSVSVPAVVGPYGGVNATLTLLGHETRVSPALRNGKYERDHENPDDRFVDDYAAVQQIATSSGLNDSGLFELDLHDPRYLPFEGAGVTARWRLTLDPDSNSFDTMTVSDVVLHLRYTARDGGEVLRRAAQQRRRAVLADVDGLPLHRLFSLKHEFPSEWHRLKTVAEPDGTHVQTVQLSRDRFPLLFRRATLAVGAVELFGVPAAGSSPTGLVTMTTPAPASTPVALGAGAPVPGLLHQRADLDPVRVLDQDAAAWRLSVPAAGVATSLDQLDDLLLLCHFTATPPA